MRPNQLRIRRFGRGDALSQLPGSRQREYLRYYLQSLGVASVVEEPSYFDRDYLAEFAAFYSQSARAYGNRCQRLHFFRTTVTSQDLQEAAGDDVTALARLQDAYLGFVVLRPIPAPLGRVVLRRCDLTEGQTNVLEPARDYECNVAGFTLRVRGLAWQQQDAAVSRCATIALWTLLHSSAFDDEHAIPTTADITRSAHLKASAGAPVFPSHGLTRSQMLQAVLEAGLAPFLFDGDQVLRDGSRAFSRARFASTCASLLRSGFPVILTGSFVVEAGRPKHAVCVVGFREPSPPARSPSNRQGRVVLEDSGVRRFFVHDDNIGPNVSFDIDLQPRDDRQGQTVDVVVMRAAQPRSSDRARKWPVTDYPAFEPDSIVTAVHPAIRTSPDYLHALAVRSAEAFRRQAESLGAIDPPAEVEVSTRLIKFPFYQRELGRALDGEVLARARLALCELEPPMSLNLGVIRVGIRKTPFFDLLIDTTDTDLALSPFCFVSYNAECTAVIRRMHAQGRVDWGAAVVAH